jgi:hypothetical protein
MLRRTTARERAVATIEIDFEAFKALTILRRTEDETYNDVVRRLLKLGAPKLALTSQKPSSGWMSQGVHFPEGTQFRVTYKGLTHIAAIKDGQWIGEDGHVRRSPSDAACAITMTNVNGWRFWSFKRPTDTSWRKMRVLQSA